MFLFSAKFEDLQIPVFIPLYYLKRVHYWEMMGWTVIELDWEPQFQQSLVYDLKITLLPWITSWLPYKTAMKNIMFCNVLIYLIVILKKTAFMVAIYTTLELGLFNLIGEEFNHSSYYGCCITFPPLVGQFIKRVNTDYSLTRNLSDCHALGFPAKNFFSVGRGQ